ncbi:hypothetical protein RB595_006891 [Gaeumannomyces hyphopodioides]
MTSQAAAIAQLCDICCQAAVFRDDDPTLHETLNDTGHAILAKAPCSGSATKYTIGSQPNRYPDGFMPEKSLRVDIFPSLPAISASAEQGCDFCAFLRTTISSEDTQDELRRVYGSALLESGNRFKFSIHMWFSFRTKMQVEDRGHGLRGAGILLTFEHDRKASITLACFAEGLTGSEPSDIWLGLGAPSSQSYKQEDRVVWISKVLKEDSKGREEVRASSFLPERLIAVEAPNPRLVITGDFPLFSPKSGNSPRYAALSYCWGKKEKADQQLKTTKATISRRRDRITEDEMTEVLRDAVSVTQMLGIPYLWVDAICILQDDITDWQRQCVDVARLYAGAAVTICAASSTSCREGFLGQRGHRIRMPFSSSKRPGLSGSFYLQFKYATSQPNDIFFDPDADVAHSRWSSRGWTFQENIAASRKLVFGSSNIHYYSLGSVRSMGCPPRRRVDSSALSQKRPDDLDEIYSSWYRVLTSYSRLGRDAFQTARDILPAISGLASHYQVWTQDSYHAGLWKEDLFRGLMWTYDLQTEQLPSRHSVSPGQSMRVVDCHLPSWSPLGSGLAIDYPVQMHRRGTLGRGLERERKVPVSDFTPAYEALAASTKPLGSGNPFGDIQSGWGLEIKSRVIDMAKLDAEELEIDETGLYLEFAGTLSYKGRCLGRYFLDFYYNLESPSKPCCSKCEIASFTWVLLGSCKVEGGDCLAGLVRQQPTGGFGLVLFSIPNSDKFCRAGVFFPGLPDYPHDGLALFEQLGEVRAVTVI